MSATETSQEWRPRAPFLLGIAHKSVARYGHRSVLSVTRCSLLASGAFLRSACAGKFLRWSLLLGLLYTFINPPFAVNDERNHLPRIHELSEGRLVTRTEEGAQYQLVPKSYQTLAVRYARIVQDPGARARVRHIVKSLHDDRERDELVKLDARASEYSPIAYLPQLPALALSRWLGLTTMARVYLARLSSMVVCSLIAAVGVALAGRLRWAFFALGLMPMFLTQAAGVSGDGMTDALAFLFFALLAKGTFERILTRRELTLLLALSSLLVYCKPPYLLLGVGVVCLKQEGARPWLRRATMLVLLLSFNAGLMAAWRMLLGSVEFQAGDGYAGHAAALHEDPAQLVGMFLASLWANLDDLTIQLVALRDILSRQMSFVGAVVAALYLQLLACLALGVHARAEREARLRVRGAALLVVMACTAAFYLAMLLSFTEAEATLIRGVQGRYFLPVAPLVLLALATCGRPVLARWLTLAGGRRVLTAVLACNALCLLSLCARYYLPSSVDWPL